MKASTLLAVLALLLPAAPTVHAQTAPVPEDPAHAEIRALRDALLDGFNRADPDALLPHLAPEFTATWPTAAVSRAPAGVRRFFDEMTQNNPIRSVHVDRLEVDGPARLHADGQAATALGSLDETFVFKNGRRMSMPCRWTATLTRPGGRWQLLTFHASTNVFDNPVLMQARAWTAGIVGAFAAIGGLLAGFGIGRAGRKRRPRHPAVPHVTA